MTLGTGIVISVAILCGTFLAVCAMGVVLNLKKQSTIDDIRKNIENRLRHKE